MTVVADSGFFFLGGKKRGKGNEAELPPKSFIAKYVAPLRVERNR